MKRLGNLEEGRRLTVGEKAFVVMLAAGVFGSWAGFNLSGVALEPFTLTATAAPPAPIASPASRSADESAQGGPRAPLF